MHWSRSAAVDVCKASSGYADSITQFLNGTLKHNATHATISTDNKYVFVSQESTSNTTFRGAVEVSRVHRCKLLRGPSCSLPDRKQVWVTERENNTLLAFDPIKMETDHLNALLVAVQMGTSPVGLRFVNNGRHMVTTNWNRFNYTNTANVLRVVNIEAALNVKRSFLRIPRRLLLLEPAICLDGTLLVFFYNLIARLFKASILIIYLGIWDRMDIIRLPAGYYQLSVTSEILFRS